MGISPRVPAAPVHDLPAGADALPDRRLFPQAGSSTKEIMFEVIRSAFIDEEVTADHLRQTVGREGGKGLRSTIALRSHERE